MKISECMTRDVEIINPRDTLREAAGRMVELDAGSLPVGDDDRLVGMVTDRDIAVRGVAEGMGPDAKVADVMTREVKYCFEDDDCADVLANMRDLKVRRLPVVSREKRLVGIISLGDLAQSSDEARAGHTLSGISEPGGAHSQALH